MVSDNKISSYFEDAREAIIIAMGKALQNEKANKHLDRPILTNAVKEISRFLFEIENP